MAKFIWRKYSCGGCGHVWTGQMRPVKQSEIIESCPKCSGDTEPRINDIRPTPGYKAGVVSKAAEITSQMLERDYGIPPSMQVDNAREGDSYVKMPASAPQIQYMGSAPSNAQAKEIIGKQLAAAKAHNGIGPNNVNGVDFVKGLSIPDPRKTAEFMSTRD